MKVLSVASFFIFFVVWASLFLRARCSWQAKAAGALVIGLVSMKYALYRLVGGAGAFFAPQLPYAVKIACEGVYNGLILLFFLLLLKDAVVGLLLLVGKIRRHPPALSALGRIKVALVALALVLGGVGVWEAVRVPEVTTVDVALPDLPPALEGAVIVQLSDLHVGPLLKKDWLAQVVARTNALHPDLIVLTGDFIDGTVADVAAEVAPLADLRAKWGVFGITGNHEYYWGAREWKAALERLGVTMPENGHRVVGPAESPLIVAGLPDLVAAQFGLPAPDIAAALRGAPPGVRLLLAHQPRQASEYAPFVDLHLAGHTHGGLLFFLRPFIALFNGGYVNGLYALGDEKLYVHPGTALWSGFSFRLGVPSAITRLVLRRAA